MDDSITIKVDSDTKVRAQELFASLGMDINTAVNMFLCQAVEFQGIPFTVRRYNDETERAIYEAQNGIGLSRPYHSIEDLREALDVGLMKGVEDIRNGKVVSLEEADRLLAEDPGI